METKPRTLKEQNLSEVMDCVEIDAGGTLEQSLGMLTGALDGVEGERGRGECKIVPACVKMLDVETLAQG